MSTGNRQQVYDVGEQLQMVRARAGKVSGALESLMEVIEDLENVDDARECLESLHTRIDDFDSAYVMYIAMPKANVYVESHSQAE